MICCKNVVDVTSLFAIYDSYENRRGISYGPNITLWSHDPLNNSHVTCFALLVV